MNPMIPDHVDPLTGTQYKRENDLGSGAFGSVRRYFDQITGQMVAVKFVDRSKMTKYMHR